MRIVSLRSQSSLRPFGQSPLPYLTITFEFEPDAFFLLNSPLNKFFGLGFIHNIYNVPLEPERAAEARRAVVASQFKKPLKGLKLRRIRNCVTEQKGIFVFIYYSTRY